MIGFGFWDSSNNGFAGVNDNVLNILDFPMESLEGDDPGEDLDAKLRSLGPITWETLQRLASTPTCQVQNGSSNLQSNLTVSSEQECQLNMMPDFVEEIPSIDDSRNSSICKEHLGTLEPCSPISGLSSGNSSFSHLKKTPISVNPPPSVLRRSKRKKKKLSQIYVIKKHPPKQEPNGCKQKDTLLKKCSHCEITKTPQWRDGPLGPKSLCNACGVRYRIGRLLPEYRPAASPTFVPSLHSNNHKKVVEMRSGSQKPDLVKEKSGGSLNFQFT